MRRMTACFIGILMLLALCTPGPSLAAPERRIALVIGNSSYSSGPLKNPVNDATDMATALQRLGFSVVLKKNAKQREMEEAIQDFGNRLKRGGVGLFYYAGHGIQVNGVNYLIPIKADINKESDVKYEGVDANRILDEMATANNGLNIVILDACRDNPFARSFRNASRGLAIVSSAPAGTFISYSTGPGQVARDGAGRNSPYTAALIQYMKEPGLPIEDVFKGVRQKLRKETGQVPWELSSLEGRFYFLLGTETNTAPIASAVRESAPEQKKAEEESLRKKAALEEERRMVDEEKQQLAIARPPAPRAAKEIGRDGRFIGYDNGTVLDTTTNLMWAAKDDGEDIPNWSAAKKYCENYRGGGYTDWRMPTQDELAALYDEGVGYTSGNKATLITKVRLTKLMKLSSYYVWAAETRNAEAASCEFANGQKDWAHVSTHWYRALPVRSVKKDSVVKQIGRDGRFIAYDNGTVLDTKTNLMWSSWDKGGENINWHDAKRYCENYRGGGYADWRMPTWDELAGLYDDSITNTNPPAPGCDGGYHLTNLIGLRCGILWVSDTRGGDAATMNFQKKYKHWYGLGTSTWTRVLPVRSPSVSESVEIGRDDRFIAYSNGTVLDTSTKLMWAAESKNYVNWQEAKKYCENYRGGGYTDWRMPTKGELVGLYDKSKSSMSRGGGTVYLTELIYITGSAWMWASETRGSDAAYLSFAALGTPDWDPQSDGSLAALPVRTAK